MSVISATERQEQLTAYKNAVRDYREGQFRSDGYLNMLNKVGTQQDNSQAWQWSGLTFESDQQLSNMYMGNGLFAKIIDRPAEDAVAKGFDLSDLGEEIEAKVQKRLTELDFSNVLSTAEKWSRLYGGAIGVIICNDGRGLEEPLSVQSFENIEEIKVFERAVVQPDYSSLYSYSFIDQDDFERRKFGQPVFYDVYSMYGSFRVHYSRCLVFKNGELPENAAVGMYQFWGIPVYTKIKNALREAITAHQDGTKLLERSVLGVYKMKGLSQLLATDEGEDNVIKRLQVIDMARNIINSMAIDSDGEDYQYINASMSGASDLIDRTCNMLSGVTDIPQTILFGRDPAGENSTGDNDRDNYFQLLNRIQTNAYQKPLNKIVKLILLELTKNGTIEKDIPDYEVRFASLRQLSEADQAAIEAQKAATEKTKADTANIYVAMQALDPSEVRRGLSKADDYQLQGIVDEDELELPENALEMPQEGKTSGAENKTLELQPDDGTIRAENQDGAPPGNQNAAGPHGGASAKRDFEAAKEYTKAVKGMTVENGVTIKTVTPHAGYQMKARNISTEDLKESLTNPDSMYPGNRKHPDATCFQKGKNRIVVSPKGEIITTIDIWVEDGQ